MQRRAIMPSFPVFSVFQQPQRTQKLNTLDMPHLPESTVLQALATQAVTTNNAIAIYNLVGDIGYRVHTPPNIRVQEAHQEWRAKQLPGGQRTL